MTRRDIFDKRRRNFVGGCNGDFLRVEGAWDAAFVIGNLAIGRWVPLGQEREQRMKGIAVFPVRDGNVRLRVVVLVRNDPTQSVTDVREFAAAPLKDTVTPPMMFKLMVAFDERSCRCVRLNGKQYVDPSAGHQPVSQCGVMRRDDIVMPTTPQTRVPRSGGHKAADILDLGHPTTPYRALKQPDSWPGGGMILLGTFSPPPA